MTFIHPLLLGGLLLVGVPVLIHLIMQQKPRHLLFPAFRFLLQKHRINQRRLRVRHLILLALRMFLIAAVCLALARPVLRAVNPYLLHFFADRLHVRLDRPAAVVLLFDTSASMEYKVGERTRLDEARRRALELLDELPEGSRVAVLDSAEAGGEWSPSPALARERVNDLRVRYPSPAVTRQVNAAYRLLADLEKDQEGYGEVPPRFLYVFSDRAEACWDANDVKGIQPPEGVAAVFVDVGEEKPEDAAVADLRLSRQVVPARGKVEVSARLLAAGADREVELTCLLDDVEARKRSVQLTAGQPRDEAFEFAADGLAPGFHRVEVRVRPDDALPYNNARYATFEVRAGRRVLLVADDRRDAVPWQFALEASGRFRCDVKTAAEARGLTPNDLLAADYKAVCLVNLAEPGADLWSKQFKDYVEKGGGLVVVPGGEEVRLDAYNGEAAREVLPARLVETEAQDRRLALPGPSSGPQPHPVPARFQAYAKGENVDFYQPEFWPRVSRYWVVTPNGDRDAVVLSYEGGNDRAALLERTLGKGRVLLFTTPLDGRRFQAREAWNNFWNFESSSFGVVLANLVFGHVAGDAAAPELNFVSGQTVPVALPYAPFFPLYTLQGPGLAGAEANVTRAQDQGQVLIAQAVAPGNFSLYDGEGGRAAGFGVNVRPEEGNLTPVPAEAVEAVFGPGAVWEARAGGALRDTLQGRAGRPVEFELFPWLMILLLLALAVENLLSNKFYRSAPQAVG
jgi:hypothetical protein